MAEDRPGPEAILATYRRQAVQWDRGRNRGLFERGWLERAARGLGAGAAVLDLGCGAGAPIAEWLIGQGFGVTGIDASPEMLALARGRFPQARWIRADMRGLALGRRYDLLIAWDSFFHLSPDDQRAMFPVFAAHLVPGGRLMFTSGPGAGEAWGRVGEEAVYHASLSPDEYVALMAANGMDLRGYLAEDPECDFHTIWLARRREEDDDA